MSSNLRQPSDILWSMTLPLELIESPDRLDSPNDFETVGDETIERESDMGEQPDRAYTLEEVSHQLDKPMTRERVRQVEVEAMRKFRLDWKRQTGESITKTEAARLIYRYTEDAHVRKLQKFMRDWELVTGKRISEDQAEWLLKVEAEPENTINKGE